MFKQELPVTCCVVSGKLLNFPVSLNGVDSVCLVRIKGMVHVKYSAQITN